MPQLADMDGANRPIGTPGAPPGPKDAPVTPRPSWCQHDAGRVVSGVPASLMEESARQMLNEFVGRPLTRALATPAAHALRRCGLLSAAKKYYRRWHNNAAKGDQREWMTCVPSSLRALAMLFS